MYPVNIIENLNGLNTRMFGIIPFANWINLQFALATRFHMQEMSGSVAVATNDVLATGRRLNTQTYAAYTAGAGWSNSAAQLALHTAGSVATLEHAGILAVGKTFQIVTIISGRTAGSVILTGTGAAAMTADDTYTDNITALGTALTYTPSTDFDGKINCATVTVQQTGILAWTSYPGVQLLDNPGQPFTFTGDDPDNWQVLNEAGSDPEVSEVGQGESHGGVGSGYINMFSTVAANVTMRQTKLVIGERYIVQVFIDGDDGNNAGDLLDGGVTIITGLVVGKNEAEFVATTTLLGIRLTTAPGNFTIRNISLRNANPMNADNTALTVGVASASSKVGYLYSGNATTAVLDRYSAEYNSKWTPDNLGVLMVAQVDTWAAGIDVLYRDGVDASNEVFILRSGADLTWTYEVGGVASTVTLTNAEAVLGNAEFTIGLSADVAGVGLQAILNGAQIGTDQAIGSAIVGNLDSTMVVSFANASTAGNSWAGDGSRLVLAHRTPTLTEHADYHQRSGL